MRKGDKLMFVARFITEEDRQRIKENRQKEKEINNYQYEAIQRMTKIESNWRVKNYKDRW